MDRCGIAALDSSSAVMDRKRVGGWKSKEKVQITYRYFVTAEINILSNYTLSLLLFREKQVILCKNSS